VVSKDLLSLLVCPENRAPVREAEISLIERLNASIERGELKNRDGQVVTDPFTEGLVREDDGVFYPVREGIPVMLIGESISLEDFNEA
jgi:uncharacterized protein YbaR (Trm112 family)